MWVNYLNSNAVGPFSFMEIAAAVYLGKGRFVPSFILCEVFPPTQVSLCIHLILNGIIIIFYFALAKKYLSEEEKTETHTYPTFLNNCLHSYCRKQTPQEIRQKLFSLSNGPDQKWMQRL